MDDPVPTAPIVKGVEVHGNLTAETLNVHMDVITTEANVPSLESIVYNVLDPVPSFTGRGYIVETLHADIEDSKSKSSMTVLSELKVITGIGGLGKTEAVRKYIWEHKQSYEHILWINAENYSDIKTCFSQIARRCNIPLEVFESGMVEAIDQIYDRVCKKACLIVFDNAEFLGVGNSEEGIRTFLPRTIKKGWVNPAIIVTSRYEYWIPPPLVQLSGFSVDECFDLLISQLSFQDTQENRDSVTEITDICEGLPIVIQQVIAIIRNACKIRELSGKPKFTMVDFLNEFHDGREDFITTEPADSPVRSSTYEIFKMAFQSTLEKKRGAIAFQCLSVMAHLNPDYIPASLLTPLIANITTDTTALEEALITLRDQNLINLNNGTYRIHRVVQLVVILYIKKECGTGKTNLTKATLNKLWTLIGSHTRFSFTTGDVLASVITEFTELFEVTPLYDDKLNEVLQNAIQVATQLVKHPELEGTKDFLRDLAEKLEEAGKYSEAETILQYLLEIYERGTGTFFEKCRAKRGLGWTFLAQKKLDAALEVYKEVLQTQESELGSNHEQTIDTKCMVATVYGRQKKYEKAVSLFECVLKNQEIKFGSGNCKTAVSKTNLANTLQDMGEYQRALGLLNEVLECEERELIPDHPDTLLTKYNLACLLQKLRRYDKAVEMLADTLLRRESVLGRNHTETLRTKNRLASALAGKGELYRALCIYEEVRAQETQPIRNGTHFLTTKRDFRPTDQPNLPKLYLLGRKMSEKERLADLLYGKSEYKRASELYDEVLKFRATDFGSRSPEMVTLKSRLAYSLTKIRNYHAALELYTQLLEHRRNSLGPSHPKTLRVKHQIARNLRKQGKYDEALRACEDILNILEQAPNVIYDHTEELKDEIARVYACQGKFEAAVKLFEDSLEHFKKELGPNHPFVKNTEQRLQQAREKNVNCAVGQERNDIS